MMDFSEGGFFFASLILFCSCLVAFGVKSRERLVALSLLQVLAALPFLAGLYVLFAARKDNAALVHLLLFGEAVFGMIWLGLAYRLGRVGTDSEREPRILTVFQCLAWVGFAALWVYGREMVPAGDGAGRGLAISHYGQAYFYAIFLLLVVLYAAWKLEVFWRTLDPEKQRAYKYLVIGGFVVCGALAWAASYRLTYALLVADHFFLLAALLLAAWVFTGYAVARHKLLNRKIFISRKVVYTFVAPTLFALYLVVLGISGTLMRAYGLSMPFVISWIAISFGGIAVCLLAFSGGFRQRVKFFISTNFYINKYEYRDEWLALSARLKGAETEAEVVDGLQQVMAGSMYATRLVIWTGDGERGFEVICAEPPLDEKDPDASRRFRLAPDDPLVAFLANRSCLDIQDTYGSKGRDKAGDQSYKAVIEEKADFLGGLGIVLLAPLSTGDQVVGLIGLGPEFTGGTYGHDDYDLLIALGSQAAAALVAVRMAEKVAEARERRAWDRLSAFVLHDIKNAAAMLALVRANAPAHIHNPAFQEDMLEVVDDALARMDKVQQRLVMLKKDVAPACMDMDLAVFLGDVSRRIGRKLQGMNIKVTCPPKILIHSDAEILLCIMENLLLNAFEACESADVNTPMVQIEAALDNDRHWVSLVVADNGPGIDPALLPELLFEPMETTREKGSGIGLWQARQLAERLNGTLEAENRTGVCGARFVLEFPL